MDCGDAGNQTHSQFVKEFSPHSQRYHSTLPYKTAQSNALTPPYPQLRLGSAAYPDAQITGKIIADAGMNSGYIFITSSNVSCISSPYGAHSLTVRMREIFTS